MRIVCDSCGAKYSIADEKVQGKVFKVRCKKCSHIIMVDGTASAGAQEEEATRVYDVSAGGGMPDAAGEEGGAIWYVVLDGAQTGPLTAREIEVQVNAGAVDADTYAWREGMEDWLRLGDVDEFAGHFGGADEGALGDDDDDPGFDEEATRVVSVSPEDHDSSGAAAGGFSFGSSFGGGGSIESFPSGGYSQVDNEPTAQAEPAPAPAASAGGGLAAAGGGGGGGFFSSAAASEPAASSGGGDMFSSAASAPASGGNGADEPHLVGERSENSVLFSLSSLTSMRGNEGGSQKSDLPTTEGSGLIDIKALASAQSSVRASSLDSMESDSVDMGGGPAIAAAAPAVLPLGTRKSNTGLIVGLSVMAVLIIGLVVAIVVVMGGGEDTPPPAPAGGGGEATAGGEQVAQADPNAGGTDNTQTPPPETTPPVDPNGQQVVAIDQDAGTPDATPAPEADAAATPEGTPTEEARQDEDEDEDEDEQEEREEREEREEVAQRDEDEDEEEEPTERRNPLEAIREAQEEEEEEEEDDLPSGLGRDDVRRTIRRYGSRIGRCDDGSGGRYTVSFVIQPSGSVTNVRAEDSGDVANCIARVVRGMDFPEFRGDSIPVTYPFNLD